MKLVVACLLVGCGGGEEALVAPDDCASEQLHFRQNLAVAGSMGEGMVSIFTHTFQDAGIAAGRLELGDLGGQNEGTDRILIEFDQPIAGGASVPVHALVQLPLAKLDVSTCATDPASGTLTEIADGWKLELEMLHTPANSGTLPYCETPVLTGAFVACFRK